MTKQSTYLIFCLLAISVSASAAPVATFKTIPDGGAVSGVAGLTVGWGYAITNEDSSLWVSADALNTSSAFADGIFDSGIFDFPIIGPGVTATATYADSSSGLAQFTWNSDASSATVNSGEFELSLAWYTQDPAECGFGCVYEGAAQHSGTAPYSANIVSQTAVPEPAAFSSALFGLLLYLLVQSKSAAKKQQT